MLCQGYHHTTLNKAEIKGLNISVHDVETDVKDSTINRICTNTKTDPTLSLVIRYVLDGWPGATNECAEPAHAYFNYREELTTIDALLVCSPKLGHTGALCIATHLVPPGPNEGAVCHCRWSPSSSTNV